MRRRAQTGMKNNRTWNPDRWISLSAVIIAGCAFFFSFYQGCTIREHNRLSVRPLVMISGAVNERGSGWKLSNAGLGPAIVRWIEVTVNGRPVKNWKEFGKEVGLPESFEFRYWYPARATVIPPQHSGELFWVPPGPADDALRSTTAKITIRMCYCSIYDESWLASGGPNVPPWRPCPPEPEVRFEAHKPSTATLLDDRAIGVEK